MPKKQDQHKKVETTQQNIEIQNIFDAITDNDLVALRQLYTWSFASAKATDSATNTKYSKLLYAAKLGHADIVQFLLFQKHDYLDLHSFNEVNENPLLEAIKAGHIDVIRVIARHPFLFRKSFKDNEGKTPFHHVGNIKNEATRKAIATILIEAGMSYEFVDDKNAKPNHYSEFVNIKKTQQLTYHSSFDELVFFKPKTEKFTDNLVSFSFICLSSGLLSLLQPLVGLSTFLLSSSYFLASLQANKKDKEYKNKIQADQIEADFIHTLLAGKLNQSMIEKYQQQGVNIEHLHTTYKTALDLAAQSGNLTMVKLIMTNGIRFNQSALHTAIDLGHINIANHFLDLPNVDIDLNKKDGATPLYTALHATKPSQAMVKMLLDRGAHTGENMFVTDLKNMIEPVKVVEPESTRFLGRWFSRPTPQRSETKITMLDYVKFMEEHLCEQKRQKDFSAFAKLIETANKQRKTQKTARNDDALPAYNKARKAQTASNTAKRPVQQQKETISRHAKKKVV